MLKRLKVVNVLPGTIEGHEQSIYVLPGTCTHFCKKEKIQLSYQCHNRIWCPVICAVS